MLRTTVGRLLINEALPPDLRDYRRRFDRKGVKALLRRVIELHPERYNEVVGALMKLGAEVSTVRGREASVSLDDLRIGKRAAGIRGAIRRGIGQTLARAGLDPLQRDDAIKRLVGRRAEELRDVNYREQLDRKNALAMQVHAGSRGNSVQFSAITAGDLLVQDHRGRIVPVPVLSSYAEGLDPAEYWAASYGARKGAIDTKLATPRGGFLAKLLALAGHRLTVTEEDCGTTNGIPVEGGDPDNVGALLARSAGGIEANTVIEPAHLKRLRRTREIIVRSPMTCQAKGGVCAACAGVREQGRLPEIGARIGLVAAQSVAEPISQGLLGSKHTAGIVGAGPVAAGFDAINQIVSVPAAFKGGATVSTVDGRVETVAKAPQRGIFVTVAGKRHYIAPGFAARVKRGDVVEAGDILSDGLPNPAELVRYKGIGAGRWHFMKILRDTLKASGIAANRRNIELLSRGLINHARIIDEDGPANTLPDDIVEFDTITRGYTPRAGHRRLPAKRAIGMYLEEPRLQYSIGTRITPRVAGEIAGRGGDPVACHEERPSFAPEMVRAMETLGHSDDWMVRMGGFHLKRNLLESVHRGLGTTERGPSYIPALARGIGFGMPFEPERKGVR